MSESSTEAWRRLLSRSAQDPFFLGSALAAYRQIHGLSRKQLEERLHCPPASFDRLTLCRLPDDQTPRFKEDVRAIAVFADCDADRLVTLLREVAVLRALGDPKGESRDSMLMAARDRKRPSKDEP